MTNIISLMIKVINSKKWGSEQWKIEEKKELPEIRKYKEANKKTLSTNHIEKLMTTWNKTLFGITFKTLDKYSFYSKR